MFPTSVVTLLHRLVFASPQVWAVARIDEGCAVRVPSVNEHLAMHARGGHGSADQSAADRWGSSGGHVDAASRPAVGCHDEVQVRAAAQGDELTARDNVLFDHFGRRPVQPADLSVKQQCEPSRSTVGEHVRGPRDLRNARCWRRCERRRLGAAILWRALVLVPALQRSGKLCAKVAAAQRLSVQKRSKARSLTADAYRTSGEATLAGGQS